MKTPRYQTQPLGIYRPQPCQKQEEHVLTIALHGDDGSLWEAGLNLDLRPAANLELVVFELPSPAQADGIAIRPVSGGQTRFSVRLAGAASRPIMHDLSDLPDQHWEAAIAATFARCPATLVVVAASSRISVALHAGVMRNPTSWCFEAVRYSFRCDFRFVDESGKLLQSKVLELAREPSDPLRVCLVQAEATLWGEPPEHQAMAPDYILITIKVQNFAGEVRSTVLECGQAGEIQQQIASYPLTLSLVLDTGGLHIACHTTAQA